MSSSNNDNDDNSEKRKISIYGLVRSEDRPIPLKSIKVDVQIFGYVAEVTSTLTYFNTEETPVEAVFTFPVDDGSAVFQFEAHIDGRHIVAEIQEREQAQLTYDDAVQSGKTAMLLKEDSSAGDIFSCMLGNLPAKTEASLVMKYVIELPQEPDGQLRFTLPTVLNPRYSPEVGGEVAAEGATYVPPSKVPYEFSLIATIKGYHKVTSVTSDTISLNVHFEDNNKIAKVSLGEDFKFDHDLRFIVQYESPYSPQIVLEDGNPEADGLLKEDILMISFHPDLKEVAMATNGEYIFVIDNSGSMRGDLIANAKEALFLFLKSLPSNCYFNIISFGSQYSSLFSSGSQKYTRSRLIKAIRVQKLMNADMGGTEILKPLEHVFNNKPIPSHPRRIFVLTDGQVGNTDAVIGLVRKESINTSTRVFTLGIGHGVSTALIDGIARNGEGKSEFITGKDRIQSKVISLLKCAMQPFITDISLEWELPPGIIPVSIPTELPNIISAGERLTLFAVLQNVDKNASYAPSTVTLKGVLDGNAVSYTLTFTLCEVDNINASAAVHRLATKLQIKLLQDQEAESTAKLEDSGYTADLNAMEEYRKKVVCLSCQGNILSKYTSFVAIDTDGKKVESTAAKISCPVPSLSSEFVKGIQKRRRKQCKARFRSVYRIADSSVCEKYENCTEQDSLVMVDSTECEEEKSCVTEQAYLRMIDSSECKTYESCVTEQGYLRMGAPVVCEKYDSCEDYESCVSEQEYSTVGAPVVCEKYDSCEDYESCVSEQEYSTVEEHRSGDWNTFNATTKGLTNDDRQQYCSKNKNGFDAICEAKVSTNKLFAHADPPALKTKSKKKARFFGCGLPLPKIFSKRFKSKGASKCSDLTSRPGEANEIGNANLRIKLYDGETNRTKEDKGDRKSVEDNTRRKSAENVTGSRESTSQQKDEANEIDNANFKIKLYVGETNRTKEDKGDGKSMEDSDSAPGDNTRKKSAENVTGSREPTSLQKGDYMISVIGLQQLNGQWNMSDQLLQQLDVTKEDVVDKLTFSKDSSVVCTVLVLAWLRKQFSQRQEEWQMIEAKALVWISTQSPSFTTEEHIKHTREVMWTK